MALVNSQVIYQFALIYQQRQAKREIKQQLRRRISETDLEMIYYLEQEDEIEWEDEGEEFQLHGEMYDVVKTASVDGKLVLYCINDKKENELLQKYLNLFKQKNTSDKKTRSFNAKLFFSQSPELYTFFSGPAAIHTGQLLSWLPKVDLELLTPPPKV